MSESDALTYAAREVVAVFATPEAMEAAVEQLGIAGVDRAAISVRWRLPSVPRWPVVWSAPVSVRCCSAPLRATIATPLNTSSPTVGW